MKIKEPHCHVKSCRTTTLSELYPLKNSSGYLVHICRDCNTEKKRKYRQTTNGKIAVTKAVRKYESNRKGIQNIWQEAQRYNKNQSCSVCGNEKVDLHHPDYDKPREVVPLCRLHHKQAHKELLVI